MIVSRNLMDYVFYKENESDEESSVLNFIESLSLYSEAKIHERLEHIANKRWINVSDWNTIKIVTWYPFSQIKVKESKNLHRVVFQTIHNDKVVVLHWFTKREGMKPKEHKKLIQKEYIEALRRFEKFKNTKDKNSLLL